MDDIGSYQEGHLYINEDRYTKLLETMKFKLNIIVNNNILENLKICDIGCATGEFLYNLHKSYPNNKYYGYDVDDKLINIARNKCNNCKFDIGNILSSKLFSENTFDIIICSGVVQIFENYKLCYDNLIKWTKKGGKIYVFGMFNDNPYDCCIKIKHTDNNDYQEGWHNISKESIIKYVNNNIQYYKFHKFNMPIDVEKKDNLLRAWTIKLHDDSRILTNGIGIIQNMELLEIIV